MLREIRSRQGVSTRSSATLIGLLIFLCLCEVGSVLVAKESAAVQGALKPLSANVQHQTWQPNQDKDRSHMIRRSQSGWIHSEESDLPYAYTESGSSLPSTSSSSATWIEPLFRQQWDPMSSSANHETKSSNDVTADAVVSNSGYWRDNELVPVSDQVESKNGVQQLNWHEAQLARLHGLGPAEIAALSTWQHKLRLHPLPNRLMATTGWNHQPPSFLPRNLLPLSGGPKSSIHSQQVLTPFDDADAPANKLSNNPMNRHQYVQQTNQTQDENLLLLPLWPKRSASEMKKSDRENNRNRNAANRKEKTESSNGNGGMVSSKGNKAKGSRKQQQQQQHSQESSHRPFSGAAATSGIDGVATQHEHNGRSSAGSSATPDVNRMNRNLATQFLLRSPRENRQYDVPIIGKPIKTKTLLYVYTVK
jgi:hypothetical protein